MASEQRTEEQLSLVERLRYAADSRPGGICEEAANEIERLLADVVRLRVGDADTHLKYIVIDREAYAIHVRQQQNDRYDRDDLLDVLLNWIEHCPDCDGYGARVNSDETETPCEFCAPANRLIARLRPPPAVKPVPPVQVPAEEIEDDIAF